MPDPRFHVTRPCDEDFSSMPGEARRHCARCQHAVHDLSAMTRAEALQLLRSRAGRELCVSYEPTPRGTPRFLPARRLRRRRATGPAALSLALAACHSGHPDKLTATAARAPARVGAVAPASEPSASEPPPATATKPSSSITSDPPAPPRSDRGDPNARSTPVATPSAAPASAPSDTPPKPTKRDRTTATPTQPSTQPSTSPPKPKTSTEPTAVDCLLGPNLPGCERRPRVTGKITGDPDTRERPHKPSFLDIKRMFHEARPKAEACGRGLQPPGSKAQIKLRFKGSTGALIDATVLTAELPPDLKRCLAAAFKGRTLPRFRVERVGLTVQIRW